MRSSADQELARDSDLVFVDPVGTGYSRPTEPEYGAESTKAVATQSRSPNSFALYRIRYNAFDAPLFLAGESYGVTRAARCRRGAGAAAARG